MPEAGSQNDRVGYMGGLQNHEIYRALDRRVLIIKHHLNPWSLELRQNS
jgi:hypothetical protein